MTTDRTNTVHVKKLIDMIIGQKNTGTKAQTNERAEPKKLFVAISADLHQQKSLKPTLEKQATIGLRTEQEARTK